MAAGATQKFYSVAHHSIVVSQLMFTHQIYGLYHEVECAVLGDTPGPMKTNSQRKIKKRIRDDFIAAEGLPPFTEEIWNEMEKADQLELGVSHRLIKKSDTELIWPEIPQMKEAKKVVRRLYTQFPPHEQLEYNCPLMNYFIKTAERLKKKEKTG